MDDVARQSECARLAERLEAHFLDVQARAMKDVPICNENLAVASAGFRPWREWAVGIVVTPWFMNIVAAPFAGAPPVAVAAGATQSLSLPAGEVAFLAADLEGFDRLLMCSLFSPMQDFADHEAALATARASLDLLLAPPPPEIPVPEVPAPNLDRRAFFRRAFVPAGAAS
jgi:[NiFe] hydrogenase assembly HybE family chaperone